MTTATETMKLSSQTLDILKNFSSINSNILIKPGNKITTISPVKNVVAETTVTETFSTEFGVWDLNKLLGTISLFDDAAFSFSDKSMMISGKNASVEYYYCEPRLLTTLDREIKMPDGVVNFELTQKQFQEIQKAASVLQLPDLCLRTKGDGMELVVLDKQTATSNNYSIDMGELPTGDHDFTFYFKVENLKLFPGDYTVTVSDSVVSQFTHKSIDLKYWIALEADSVYNS